ncbi:MAG: two-component regulator propeller domain-containing protein [Thiolinea sp.]
MLRLSLQSPNIKKNSVCKVNAHICQISLRFASMRQIFLSIILCLFSATSLAAELRFTHLDASSGLRQGSIDSLTQDRYGFLWLGTEDGLVRYDGRNAVTYRNDPEDLYSIPDNVITALLYGRDGRLWIGSEADGVSYYDYKSDHFIRLNREHTGSNISIFFDYIDDTGILIKSDKGLILLRHDGTNEVLMPYELSKDLLLVFNENGVINALLQSGTVFQIPDTPGKTGNQFTVTPAPVFARPIQDCILVRDITGATWCLAKGKMKPHPLSSILNKAGINPGQLHLMDLVMDASGVIWLTTGLGLLRVEGEQITVFRSLPDDPYSLSSNKLSKLLLGKRGELFVGTQTKGLNITSTRYPGITTLRTTNSAYQIKADARFPVLNEAACGFDEGDYNTVWSILKDSDNDLWVGNFSGLAYRPYGSKEFRDHSQLVFHEETADLCSVWSLAEAKGLIWIGTWNGLYAYSKKEKDFIHYRIQNETGDIPTERLLSDNAIRILLYDEHRDSLWIATNHGGLNRLDFEKNQITHYPYASGDKTITHKRIRSLYLDKDRRLWVGSGGGLSLWDEQTDTFRTLTASVKQGGLSDEDVRSIHQLDKNHLLIGTGNGLNFFNIEKFSVERRYSEKDGLSNSTIYATVADHQGKILISTANGLNYFNPKNSSFEVFTVENGLQSNEFNFNAWHKDSEGIIYLGGTNGLTLIDPKNLLPEEKAYSPIITKLAAYDPGGKEIILSRMLTTDSASAEKISTKLRDIYFTHTFPAFNNNSLLSNDIKLTPESLFWSSSNTGASYSRYTNLKPGIHNIQLKSNSSDDEIFRYAFTISHYFWEFWWFQFLLALAFMSAIAFFSIYFYKVRARIAMEKIVQQNYRIVEHELRPHLSEVKESLHKLTGSNSLIADDRKIVETSALPVLNKSIQFLLDLRSLIDFGCSRESYRHIYMLEDEVKDALAFFKNTKREIRIEQLEDINVKVHQGAVYLVIKNLVSNAINYSPDNCDS